MGKLEYICVAKTSLMISGKRNALLEVYRQFPFLPMSRKHSLEEQLNVNKTYVTSPLFE